jgi:Na+-transporting NADH:ubiquinone oxidoreductase subunit NqrE
VAPQKLTFTRLISFVQVKEAFRQILEIAQTNYKRELDPDSGVKLTQISLNRIFWGSPGTGKSTVSRLASVLQSVSIAQPTVLIIFQTVRPSALLFGIFNEI